MGKKKNRLFVSILVGVPSPSRATPHHRPVLAPLGLGVPRDPGRAAFSCSWAHILGTFCERLRSACRTQSKRASGGARGTPNMSVGWSGSSSSPLVLTPPPPPRPAPPRPSPVPRPVSIASPGPSLMCPRSPPRTLDPSGERVPIWGGGGGKTPARAF